MSGAFDTSFSHGRTVLALVLCLLAFTFAFEAKLAWYGPERGLGSEVRAAKALPADTHQLIPPGLGEAIPISPLISLALMAAIAAACLRPPRLLDQEVTNRPVAATPANYFSPQHFFRPPPTR